jgi:hypothetical protein
MTTIPVTYAEIHAAYAKLISAICDAWNAQQVLNQLEGEKADIWAQLTSNPDFKPGNSNLQRDAKLRDANPLFMKRYEEKTAQVDELKLKADVARQEVAKLKDMLVLGRILTALKDEEA